MKVRNFKDVSLWDLLATVDHFSEVEISIYCEEHSIYNIAGRLGDIVDDLHIITTSEAVMVEHLSLKPFTPIDEDGITRRGDDHLLEIKGFISDLKLKEFFKKHYEKMEGLDL